MARRLFAFILLVVPSIAARPAHAQATISTVAGSSWLLPASGPALNAPFGRIAGIAADSSGNIYASDSDNNVILKITPAGMYTIVAGNGTPGFSGDGERATSAALQAPSLLALDNAGNLFVWDGQNYRVRKISADGLIFTMIAAFGRDGRVGDSYASGASALAVDAGANVYFSGGRSFGGLARPTYLIYRVSPDGSSSTVSASDPNLALTVTGLLVDRAGNLLVSNSGFAPPWGPSVQPVAQVVKLTPDGASSLVAGRGAPGFSGDGGPATLAALSGPSALGIAGISALAMDAAGNLFIMDGGNNRIRKVSADGIISTVAGNGINGFSGDGGLATAAALQPGPLAIDAAGNLYLASYDGLQSRIRKIAPDGVITTVTSGNGSFKFGGDGGPAARAWLHLYPGVGNLFLLPVGMALNASGNLFVADRFNNRVRKITTDGVIYTVAGNGTTGLSGDGGPATSSPVNQPEGLAVDPGGNVFVCDVFVPPNPSDPVVARGRKISPDGIISSGGACGTAMATDGTGTLFVGGTDYVGKLTADGVLTRIAGGGDPIHLGPGMGDGGSATKAALGDVGGLAINSAGNIFLADRNNQRIRKISPDGIISSVAGRTYDRDFSYSDGGPATSANLSEPLGVALDAKGNIFIADTGNNRVRRVTPDGRIFTVAGNGSRVYSGDGGPAINAGLSATALAVDAAGNLFIADSFNDRIRKVEKPADAEPCCILVNQSGLVNGASYSSGLATGSIVSLFGQGLGDTRTGLSGLSTNLGGVSVLINGIPASLFYVSDRQVNLQIPWELAEQYEISVAVSARGIKSVARTFSLSAAAPGIFSLYRDGKGQGAVQIANSNVFAAPAGYAGQPARPANRGEYITIYCTGLGDVTNRPGSGVPASSNPLSVALTTPTVTIGGQPAVVSFSGLTPGFVGLCQINVRVPADAPSGDAVPLTVTQAGIQSNTVTIAIQ